jgi:hypothetical protein
LSEAWTSMISSPTFTPTHASLHTIVAASPPESHDSSSSWISSSAPHWMKTTVTLASTTDPSSGISAPLSTWEFDSLRSVQLPRTDLHFTTFKGEMLSLSHPTLLGFGGGGAVFGVSDRFALKISWESSTAGVSHECAMERYLAADSVESDSESMRLPARHVIQCVGEQVYPYATTAGTKDAPLHADTTIHSQEASLPRTMILLQPLFPSTSVNHIEALPQEWQARAVQFIWEAALDLLAAGVVTTDVQFLMDSDTGNVLLLDLTEARHITTKTLSPLEVSYTTGFLQEILALTPNEYYGVAAHVYQSYHRPRTWPAIVNDWWTDSDLSTHVP